MTPEEKRLKDRERARRWRAANPEWVREKARRSMAKWRRAHPDAARQKQAERRKLRATNEAWRRMENARVKAHRDKWRGIPETEIHARFQVENPNAVSMDHIRPDFYIPGNGFVEIKRALPVQRYNWRANSVHFPGLYFLYGVGIVIDGHRTASIDEQISIQPRPLLVIVYHAITGEEIARKLLTSPTGA